MKRVGIALGVGLVLGFACSLVTAAAIGTIYAAELSLLIPDNVTETALTVADKVQGYDHLPPPKH